MNRLLRFHGLLALCLALALLSGAAFPVDGKVEGLSSVHSGGP